MTHAVCFNCGEMKFGAWVPCKACGVGPSGDAQLALSLALSDHYQDDAGLERIAQLIRGGQRVEIDEETQRKVLGR